ncbi:MAG: hypothetical protein JNJ41_11145 [Bacteroidia bacterium]|nr:hypothetical protein [Bacteroidia bacterium]
MLKIKNHLFHTTIGLILISNLYSQSFKDQGIWNDFHKFNLGKIVFSEKKIVDNSPDPSLVKNSFNLLTPIKGRLYVNKSLANLCADAEKSGKYPVGCFDYTLHPKILLVGVIKINGIEHRELIWDAPNPKAQKEEWTTWWYNFIPELEKPWGDFRESSPEYTFGQIIQSLSPGNHKIDLEFLIKSLDATKDHEISIAKGSINLNFTETQKKIWLYKFKTETQKSVSSSIDNRSDYVMVKNECGNKIEFSIEPSGVSNDFMAGNSRSDYAMKEGDRIKLKYGGVIYTHKKGNKGPVYLCK